MFTLPKSSMQTLPSLVPTAKLLGSASKVVASYDMA